MLQNPLRSYLAGFVAIAILSTTPLSVLARTGGLDPAQPAAISSPDANQARSALDQGKSHLRRNRLDQALNSLENALSLFTQVGDKGGEAAAHDALGDLYARQGQHDLAISHYKSAQEAFSAKNEANNANLMLSKIGETQFLRGNISEARAAFDQISQNQKRSGAGAAPISGSGSSANTSAPGNGNERDRNAAGAAIILAQASASLASGVACSSKANNNSNNSDPNNTANNEPPNMGRAPAQPDGIGRLDLRITDQNGNPVKGVKAQLKSRRPNGFSCDCWDTTDDTGRAVLPPLHIGQIKLVLKAPGLSQELPLQPSQLAEPVRVVIQGKTAAVQAAKTTTQVKNVIDVATAIGQCLNLYQFFLGYAASELGLGRADFFNNQLDSSQKHFENLLAAAGITSPIGNLAQARRFRVAARTALGDIALRQNRLTDALRLYTEAADGARKDQRLDLVWGAQRGLGKTKLALATQEADPQKALKLREEALSAYRDSLKAIETIFAGSVRADEARTSLLATTKEVFDEAASALAEMALSTTPAPAQQVAGQALAHAAKPPADAPLAGKAFLYAAEAFKIAEQARSRSLLDMLGEVKAEITEGVPEDLLKRKAENLDRQQEIAEQLTGISLAGATPKQPIEQLEAELERLQVEQETIENQIRVASPRYASLTKAQPLTVVDVQQKVLLDDKTALLEYSLGKDHSYLWVVTQSGLRLYKLPARSVLEQQAMDLRAQILPASVQRSIVGIDVAAPATRGLTGDRGLGMDVSSPTPKNLGPFTEAAYTLYKSAVEPAAAVIGDRRMLIVADGALNYIPFEALITASGGTDFATLPYLVKTNEIVYAPSASVIAAVRQQANNAAAKGRGILLVADPVFDASDARAKGAATGAQGSEGMTKRGLSLSSAISDITKAPAKGLKLARLNGTRTEAEQIAQLARSTGGQADVWLDFEASETKVRAQDIKQYRVLHFATHGLLNAERPQFTGLALSLVGDNNQDGFLRVDEVFNLRLGSPLVMLSACETGLGKERRGEGVIGLTRAFMYAGAPTVGVSLWSVADKSTSELMPDFYKRLLAEQSTSSGAALRAAQIAMIDGKRYSAPFYWAPFVLVGDWR